MRKATILDTPHLQEAVLRLKKVSTTPWMKITHERTALSYLAQAVDDGRVWVFGAFMVMVDVGSPWFTDKLCLIEELVIKVYPEDKTYSLPTVLHAGMEQLASHHGCEATVVGDTQCGLMTPLYIAAGFVPIGTQLFKENTHGLPQEGHS